MRTAVALVLASTLMACHGVSPSSGDAPDVVIDKIEIAVAQSYPVQIRLLVQGHLTKSCSLGEPVVEQRGDTFYVELRGSDTAGDDCKESQSFRRWIPLPVHGLEKGVYKVIVEGQETSFTL